MTVLYDSLPNPFQPAMLCLTTPRGNMTAAVNARLQAVGSEQLALLDLMDKIQSAQLEDDKLPQIAVVGEQSSGKSSVLEAITGIPFPRDPEVCTRFATEIRLRRADKPELKAKIIPDKTRSPQTQERLRRFEDKFHAGIPFGDLFDMAKAEITSNSNRFTRDKLVIESFGRDLPLLTLVDLPGIVKNHNTDQTPEDIAAIEAITDRYMRASRTVILVVIGGNIDYGQASIMDKVRKYDPTGSRTIGVMTKPDVATHQGLESRFLRLVNNNDMANRLALGWFVMINPDHKSQWPTPQERAQKEEEFFSQGGWSTLPPTMCGTVALTNKLSEQLRRHIIKHIPSLRKQVQYELDNCEKFLNALGPGRDNVDDMRSDLVGWLNESKGWAKSAVNGDYVNEPGKDFFPVECDPSGIPAENLRARVVKENQSFADHLRLKGHSEQLVAEIGSSAAVFRDSGGKKKAYAKNEVARRLEQFKGTQLPGDRNHRVAYTLFQDHSKDWRRLAQDHMDRIAAICNQFVCKVLDYVWPTHMHEPLRQQFLAARITEISDAAQDELNKLFADLTLEVQTYDRDYERRLDKWMEHRRAAVRDNDSANSARFDGMPDEPFTEPELVLEQSLVLYDVSCIMPPLKTCFCYSHANRLWPKHSSAMSLSKASSDTS